MNSIMVWMQTSVFEHLFPTCLFCLEGSWDCGLTSRSDSLSRP